MAQSGSKINLSSKVANRHMEDLSHIRYPCSAGLNLDYHFRSKFFNYLYDNTEDLPTF